MKVSVILALVVCLQQGLTSPTPKPDKGIVSSTRKPRHVPEYGGRTRGRNSDNLGRFGGSTTSSSMDYGNSFGGRSVTVTTTVDLLGGLSDEFGSSATSDCATPGNCDEGSDGVYISGHSDGGSARNGNGYFLSKKIHSVSGAPNIFKATGNFDTSIYGPPRGADEIPENKRINIGFTNDTGLPFRADLNFQKPFPPFSLDKNNYNPDDSNCICPSSSGWTPDQLSEHQKRMNLTGKTFDCFCLGPENVFFLQKSPLNPSNKPTMSCFCPKPPGWNPEQYALLSKQTHFTCGLTDCFCAKSTEISEELKAMLESSRLTPTTPGDDEAYPQSHLSVVSLDGDLKVVQLGPLYIRLG